MKLVLELPGRLSLDDAVKVVSVLQDHGRAEVVSLREVQWTVDLLDLAVNVRSRAPEELVGLAVGADCRRDDAEVLVLQLVRVGEVFAEVRHALHFYGVVIPPMVGGLDELVDAEIED